MTIQTIIPAGYRITVVSWENDGDNYNTKVVEGIETKEQAQFFVDLCRILYDDLGNLYDPDDGEKEQFGLAALAVFEKHAGHLPEAFEDVPGTSWTDAAESAHEILYEFFGGSEYYTRVLDSLKVEYIPHPIHLDDVTSQFA